MISIDDLERMAQLGRLNLDEDHGLFLGWSEKKFTAMKPGPFRGKIKFMSSVSATDTTKPDGHEILSMPSCAAACFDWVAATVDWSVPETASFLSTVFDCLKPGGRFVFIRTLNRTGQGFFPLPKGKRASIANLSNQFESLLSAGFERLSYVDRSMELKVSLASALTDRPSAPGDPHSADTLDWLQTLLATVDSGDTGQGLFMGFRPCMIRF
ncbi:MAG: hypothetical protein HQL76_03735 [Magnetococcales bacterium]|nr:hypothetical protein [Magnetococcales bacterium]